MCLKAVCNCVGVNITYVVYYIKRFTFPWYSSLGTQKINYDWSQFLVAEIEFYFLLLWVGVMCANLVVPLNRSF